MTPEKRKALGRGLESLLPAVDEGAGAVSSVPVGIIEPNPHQPRRTWDEEELRGLADSVREQGILQPLVLRRVGMRYQVIAGERRLRAARLAGLGEVPALVREASDLQMLAWALVENIQRRDLGPLEKAEAFDRLSTTFGLTQEEMGRQTGLNRSTVSNLVRLLELPDRVKDMLRSGVLSMGHGRALLGVQDGARLEKAALAAVEKGMSVRQLESHVKKLAGPSRKRVPSAEVRSLEDRLSRRLGARVRIRESRGRGRLSVEFASLAELDRLIELIEG
jgi:ParB family chromosome partitioning protein